MALPLAVKFREPAQIRSILQNAGLKRAGDSWNIHDDLADEWRVMHYACFVRLVQPQPRIVASALKELLMLECD